jgi:molybdopterin-containing oxidoreductase family molybdopterin binding subunit
MDALSKSPVKEDVWIPTCCGQCYCMCGIKVRRQDGVVTEVEGNPDSPTGRGTICVKGLAAPHLLYDPYRVNYPLKRTNPKKGLGEDPKFVRISWEEAYDIIVKKLKECQERDPRGLFFQATTTQASEIRFGVIGFMKAFGTPNYWVSGGGLHCGNGAHFMNGIMHVSWSIIPDFAHCNYALNFGCSKGHGAGHVAVQNATQVADARYRGFKNVVFDPFMSAQASKAHEWVPIRVGTDGAVALGLVNSLLNEHGIYDAEYLMYKTNAPYLIRPDDGRYVRDKETNKPLVWDVVDNGPKAHDNPSVTRVEYEDVAHEVALTGTFKVNGLDCRPSFELLKEHVKKYSPEYVEKISWVPAKALSRIAREFGEAAEIGSSVTIQTDKGPKRIPKRPAATHFFRGSQGHTNSGWTCLSIDMVNHIVGSGDTWGGEDRQAVPDPLPVPGRPAGGEDLGLRPQAVPVAGAEGAQSARPARHVPDLDLQRLHHHQSPLVRDARSVQDRLPARRDGELRIQLGHDHGQLRGGDGELPQEVQIHLLVPALHHRIRGGGGRRRAPGCLLPGALHAGGELPLHLLPPAG